MKKSLVFVLLLVGFSHGLGAHPALDDFLKNLQNLQTQFEQRLFNEAGELVERSEGKFYLQRPDKFRWDYQQPYQQLIVADGKKVWIYDKDLNQVTVKSFQRALGQTPASLLISTQAVEEDFFINELPAKEGVTRLELIPKNAQAQFESMRLILRGKILLGFELVDNLGQTTLITCSELKRNPILNDHLFLFTPPVGADIIKDF
jgi:outer membrane lipoprotein carrier protein